MIPFERALYVMLLQQWIEEENNRVNEQNRKMRG